MGDVADILGLAGGSGGNSDGSSARGRAASSSSLVKSSAKKPSGMSREVFSLLDPAALASIAPTRQTMGPPTTHNKGDAASAATAGITTQWRWTSFANSCRRDGLRLNHWQRATAETTSEYQFARFNKHSYVIEYSDAAYAMIAAADAGVDDNDVRKWTRSDCDYLLMLCNQYDLRWPIIADRWTRTPQRTALEIKSRYYRMAHLLLAIPSSTSPTLAASSSNAVTTTANPASCITAAVATPAEIAGINETGALDQSTTAVSAPGAPSLISQNAGDAMEIDTGSNNSTGLIAQTMWPETTATITAKAKGAARAELSGFVLDEGQEARHIANLDRQFLRSKEQEIEEQQLLKDIRIVVDKLKRLQKDQGGSAAKAVVNTEATAHLRVAHFGAADGLRPKRIYLRSARMLTMPTSTGLGARLVAKLSTLLTELDVPLRPLPTALVCNSYDKLRQDAVKLLALQRFLHNKRKDLSVAKGVTMSSLVPPPATITAAIANTSAVPSSATDNNNNHNGISSATMLDAALRTTKKAKKLKTSAAATATASGVGPIGSATSSASLAAAAAAAIAAARKAKRKKASAVAAAAAALASSAASVSSNSSVKGSAKGSSTKGSAKGKGNAKGSAKTSVKRPRASSSKKSEAAAIAAAAVVVGGSGGTSKVPTGKIPSSKSKDKGKGELKRKRKPKE